MIVKTGDKSIATQVSVNRKTINKTTYYDDALHIKNKFRVLRDLATDSVVDTLFRYEYKDDNTAADRLNYNNSIKRNLFLMYVYDYFNLNIISDFEYYLLTNNCEILNSEYEYVKFLFKGGNVYFHIVYELIQKYNIFKGITPDQKNTIIDEFSKAFKISDFDFTINLYCITHNKFIKVKKYLVEFIIKKLEEVTIFFNGYISRKLKSSKKFIPNNECFEQKEENNENNQDICLNETTKIDTQSNILESDQKTSSIKLKLINDFLSELYNNKLFRPFVLAINKTTDVRFNLDVVLNGQINDNLLEYYAKLISTFINSDKIKNEIKQMISSIRFINLLLADINLYTSFEKNNKNKEFNAMIINVFLKISFINDYYNSTKIFVIKSDFNLNTYQKHQNDYFSNLEKIFDEIDFYSENSIINIIQSIAKSVNSKIKSNDQYEKYAKEPNEDFLFTPVKI